MKVSKIVCDRCGTEIKEKNPIRMSLEISDEETSDTIKVLWAFADYDFCDKCSEEIMQFAKKKTEGFEKDAVIQIKEPTKEELAGIKKAMENMPPRVTLVEPKEPTASFVTTEPEPTVTDVKEQKAKPTVQELILQGVPKKEVVEITGCKGSSYNQIKCNLRKKGLLPQQQKQNQPDEEAKTYQCSKVMSKCIYATGNGLGRTCDYIEITGHRRGCKPEECTKFIAK